MKVGTTVTGEQVVVVMEAGAADSTTAGAEAGGVTWAETRGISGGAKEDII